MDRHKYSYKGYGIGFNTHVKFSLPDVSVGKMYYLDILILGKGLIQGLNDNTLIAETQYLINFRRANIKFCLSLHYNGSDSFLFVNSTKNLLALSNRLGNKNISLVFRKYFRRNIITWKKKQD